MFLLFEGFQSQNVLSSFLLSIKLLITPNVNNSLLRGIITKDDFDSVLLLLLVGESKLLKEM